MTDFSKLQNGSDIRGIALPGVEGEEVNLNVEVVNCISAAFAKFLHLKTGKDFSQLKISLGMDSRLSGPDLRSAAATTITGMGCQVEDFGLASTPAMFTSTITPGFLCDGAIMLTASHLPWNRNGLKFFTARGGLEKKDVAEILELASAKPQFISPQTGRYIETDFMQVYASQLCEMIREGTQSATPFRGLKILVDAGNGAGGFFAHRVLEPLGADISGSQFLQPDGSFPNHIPNPEAAEAMDAISAAVVNHKADLGIIFDTDVDRAALVDSKGRQLNRNVLVALMSAIILEEHPESTIVTDSITSDGLSLFISKLGGRHHRFKRGYKNVINEAIRLNRNGQDSWLAIETSGHAAMRENHFLDDGAYLIAKVLIKMARSRHTNQAFPEPLLAGLLEPAEDHEYRFQIIDPDFHTYGKKVLEELLQFVGIIDGWSIVPDNYEGIRVACDNQSGDGWFLLRMSLHDPVMPLNVESNKTGGVKQIMSMLTPFFEKHPGLKMK